MREEELCRDDDVVEDDKVTAETVGGAELRQHQMHLVNTRRQRKREGRTQVFRSNTLTMTAAWMRSPQTNKAISTLENCKTLQAEAEEGKAERRERDRITTPQI